MERNNSEEAVSDFCGMTSVLLSKALQEVSLMYSVPGGELLRGRITSCPHLF